MRHIHYEEFAITKFLFSSPKMAFPWLVVRLYVGWEWLSAGWDKLHNTAWWGDTAGAPLIGFVQGALQKTGGLHPDVQMWYANFLTSTVLPNAVTWSNMVALGEFLVGVALILGFLVGVSAFFGAFMNLNYLLAGTVSANPIFLMLGISLILAWRVSGYFGLDYYVLPKVARFLGRR